MRLGMDDRRACLLDRESVVVTGWGELTRREIVGVADHEKPWDDIAKMRDRQGRAVCPVALVDDEEREWVALETDAGEYGRPIEWTERTETGLRIVRSAKAEAGDAIRSEVKKSARKAT